MSTSRLGNRFGSTRHWSFLDLQSLLSTTGNWSTRHRPVLFTTTAVRFYSTRDTNASSRQAERPPVRRTRAFDGKEKTSHFTTRDHNIKPSSSRTSYSNSNHGQSRERTTRPSDKYRDNNGESIRKPKKPMPWNFRTVPDTERIEGIEKQALQVLFVKQFGASSVSNDFFNIKACRMPFREPQPKNVPPFVQKALVEYEHATLKYEQDLVEYEQWRQGSKQENEQQLESTTSATPKAMSPIISKPIPPSKPLFVIQHELRNTRQYPDSVDAPHPPFRVTFILSKKQISKLSTHRNHLRKKLAAAAEMVFRDHARPGYEYMIFAKIAAMTTPQVKLIQVMRDSLTNPILYGERSYRKSDPATADTNTTASSTKNEDGGSNNQVISGIVRWKNNCPPIRRQWWRHALPNPLGRVQQTDAYLDKYCPKEVEVKENFSEPESKTRNGKGNFKK
ncbi:hypothetical protein BGZ46_005774 [Entomortierella lignicola]|nr:hypothetical protein BGZ46_005774 [Entomortierella lignicola]